MSMRTVKENERAGTVSTFSAEKIKNKKCFKLQTQDDRMAVSKLQCFSAA